MSITAEEVTPLKAKKKSGLVAALLNTFVPGAGYMYCGHWILGIGAFVFVVTAAILSFGYAVGILWLTLVVDGILSAEKYNENLQNNTARKSTSPK